MPVINISIENKIAEADGTLYVCDNSDFVAKFAFDAEWEAYENKTARFVYNNSYVDVVFTGNECPVPIISGTYFFNIGVYAGNLHTTTPARVPCKKSIRCGNEPESSASQEVRNEFLGVLDKRTGDLADLTTEAKDTLVAAINEAARTGGGSGSMDLRVADGYVQYSTDGGSTWTNLIAVAELKGADGARGKDGVDGKPGAAGADGITPHIGDNGNWYLGAEDTGKPSRGATGAKGDTGAPGKDGAGMDITGATVGQIAKITAVDSDGKPTAWSPVDMPSGGGTSEVSWHAWDNVIVPEGGLNAFDFTTLASGEKLSDHQVKGMFIYSPSAVSAATTENDQTATLTVNGDYVFSLATFTRSVTGYLRLLLTVEDGRLIVRYYKRDTDDRVDFPATTVTINKEDLHSFSNLTKASTTIIGYGKTLKLFNRIESVRIESSGQVAKDVEFDVQVLY